MNSNGEDNLAYDSQAENVAISDIPVIFSEGVQNYIPTATSLHSDRYISDL